MDGYNACIIAYGQTGSGKTYTMMGTKEDRGVCWRALEELFALCKKDENVNFSLDISMMEVYNEHVYDLLVPFREQPINVHVRPNGSIHIEELHRTPVSAMQQVKVIWERGLEEGIQYSMNKERNSMAFKTSCCTEFRMSWSWARRTGLLR